MPAIPSAKLGVWYEADSYAWGSSLQTIASGNNISSFEMIYYYDVNGKPRKVSGYDAGANSNNHTFKMLHSTGFPERVTEMLSTKALAVPA